VSPFGHCFDSSIAPQKIFGSQDEELLRLLSGGVSPAKLICFAAATAAALSGFEGCSECASMSCRMA